MTAPLTMNQILMARGGCLQVSHDSEKNMVVLPSEFAKNLCDMAIEYLKTQTKDQK